MELPNRGSAFISSGKLLGYLLSETHAIGKSKAKFFRSFGFDAANADLLERELIAIAQSQPVVAQEASPFGTKYVVDGQLDAPDGSSIRIRTVWIIENHERRPRLVTAVPLKKTQ